MRIGFIGTGTISSAVIEGLQRLPERHEILVSPRSEAMSTALAAKYPNVHRAADNAEVAHADLVFLGMRPAHLEAALEGIAFGPGQIVASMVAGFSLADAAARWPRAKICRFIPLPGIARGLGPMTTYPAIPEITALFSPLGDLFAVETERHLDFGGLNAFMSTYYELQQHLIGFATATGHSEPDARRYAVSLLAMLSDTARRARPEEFERLVSEHETKGGLNESVRKALLAAGWFDEPRAALDATRRVSYKTLG